MPEILSWEPGTKGKTPLWDNIDAALRMLSPHEIGDVIVVVSDGGDNMSNLNPHQVRKELLEAHVPILPIILVDPTMAPFLSAQEGQKDLLDLAEKTGGAVAVVGPAWPSIPFGIVSPLTPEQLISQFAHQYDLEVEIPLIQEPERWNLSAKSKETGEKLSLFYPRYLSPCAAIQ